MKSHQCLPFNFGKHCLFNVSRLYFPLYFREHWIFMKIIINFIFSFISFFFLLFSLPFSPFFFNFLPVLPLFLHIFLSSFIPSSYFSSFSFFLLDCGSENSHEVSSPCFISVNSTSLLNRLRAWLPLIKIAIKGLKAVFSCAGVFVHYVKHTPHINGKYRPFNSSISGFFPYICSLKICEGRHFV